MLNNQEWFFWDETWTCKFGPFDTREEAELKCIIKHIYLTSKPQDNTPLFDTVEIWDAFLLNSITGEWKEAHSYSWEKFQIWKATVQSQPETEELSGDYTQIILKKFQKRRLRMDAETEHLKIILRNLKAGAVGLQWVQEYIEKVLEEGGDE